MPITGWVVNTFFVLVCGAHTAPFPAICQDLMADGVSCYTWFGGGAPDVPPPACPYQPAGQTADTIRAKETKKETNKGGR